MMTHDKVAPLNQTYVIGLLVTSDKLITVEQCTYLLQAYDILKQKVALKLILFTQLELSLADMSVVRLESELTQELLEAYQINSLITPDVKHLQFCETSNVLVCLLHQHQTFYPMTLVFEQEVFNQQRFLPLLQALAYLQKHSHYFIEIMLLRTFGKTIDEQILYKFKESNGKVCASLFLQQADVQDVLKHLNPTLYVKVKECVREYWFDVPPVGVLYI